MHFVFVNNMLYWLILFGDLYLVLLLCSILTLLWNEHLLLNIQLVILLLSNIWKVRLPSVNCVIPQEYLSPARDVIFGTCKLRWIRVCSCLNKWLLLLWC